MAVLVIAKSELLSHVFLKHCELCVLPFAVGLLNLGLLVEQALWLNLQGIFCFDLAGML